MLTERDTQHQVGKHLARVLKAVLPKESSRYAITSVLAEQVHIYMDGRIRDCSKLTVTDGRQLVSFVTPHNLAEGLYDLKDDTLIRSDDVRRFPEYQDYFSPIKWSTAPRSTFLKALVRFIANTRQLIDVWRFEKTFKAFEKLPGYDFELGYADKDRPMQITGKNSQHSFRALFMPFSD